MAELSRSANIRESINGQTIDSSLEANSFSLSPIELASSAKLVDKFCEFDPILIPQLSFILIVIYRYL